MSDDCRHLSRRQMVRSLLSGSILMPAVFSQLLAAEGRAGALGEENPLAPRAPHFPAKAKRVIFIYLPGGCSHVDSFDYKPKLIADAKAGVLYQGKRKLLAPLWEFKQRGESGLWVSELFPHIAGLADELCVVNSMRGDHNDHFQATMGIHTGSVTFKRPSLGSWVSYGLGTENQNLPSFVALAPLLPYAGAQVWDSDFLPAVHQGTRVVAGAEPVANLNRRSASPAMQEAELGLLERFNRRHLRARVEDSQLAARIKSYETAFGMQREMPEVLDLTKETEATLKLYGLERGQTTGFGWQCLVARRMAERGVRFIELIDVGASKNWDAHGDMKTHGPLARNIDQPIAGLIRDLKSRGMLDETLVVWTTEFGRSPAAEGEYGRGHFCFAYSSWLAGGGIKGGMNYGQSDDYGMKVAENECHVHDFHATILHQLGFDHTKLTFRHAGRDFRLTDVHGRVVKEILA
ncbi:MAG TPA: DUF1501 domain-containing protein [Blastocatellia bacterium]|nr:DUF1501 domain-containing protein [Blastocatellia bacterium]